MRSLLFLLAVAFFSVAMPARSMTYGNGNRGREDKGSGSGSQGQSQTQNDGFNQNPGGLQAPPPQPLELPGGGGPPGGGDAPGGGGDSGGGQGAQGSNSNQVQAPRWIIEEYRRRQAQGFETPSRVPNRGAEDNDPSQTQTARASGAAQQSSFQAAGAANAGAKPAAPAYRQRISGPILPPQESRSAAARASDDDAPRAKVLTGRDFVSPSLVYAKEKLLDGDYAGAARAARDAPGDPGAYKLLARALFKLGDLAGAKEAILKALKLDPNDAEAYRLLAAIDEALGDHTGALRCLEQAARLDPAYQGSLEAARAGGRIGYPDLGDLGLTDELARTAAWWRGLRGLLWFLAGAACVGVIRQRRGSAPAA